MFSDPHVLNDTTQRGQLILSVQGEIMSEMPSLIQNFHVYSRNDLHCSLIQQELLVRTMKQNLFYEQQKLEMLQNLKGREEHERFMTTWNKVSIGVSQSTQTVVEIGRIYDWSSKDKFEDDEEPMNEEDYKIEDLVVEEVIKYREEKMSGPRIET